MSELSRPALCANRFVRKPEVFEEFVAAVDALGAYRPTVNEPAPGQAWERPHG